MTIKWPCIRSFYVLLGFLISHCCISQSKEDLESNINTSINQIISDYYFSNTDSAILLLDTLGQHAIDQKLFYHLLNVKLIQASAASYNSDHTLLYYFIQQGDSILHKYQSNIIRKDKKAELRSNLLYLKGRYFYDRYDFHTSVSHFKKINKLNPSDSLLIFDVNLTIGQAYYNLNDYTEADHYYKLAELWLPTEHPDYAYGRDFNYQKSFISSLKGRALFYRGVSTQSKADIEKAEQLFQVALNVIMDQRSKSGVQNLMATLHRRLAEVYDESGKFDMAISQIEKLLSIDKLKDDDLLKAYLLAGEIMLHKKDLNYADVFFIKAWDKAVELPDNHPLKGEVLLNFSRSELLKSKPRKAIEHINEALKYFTDSSYQTVQLTPLKYQIKNDKEVLEALELKGKAYHRLSKETANIGLMDTALLCFEAASDLFESMRDEFLSAESRQFLSSRSMSIYEKALEIAFDAYNKTNSQYYLDKAFYFIDKNKSTQVLQANQHAYARSTMNIPTEILVQENEILSQIAYIKRKILKSEKSLDLRKQFDDVLNKRNEFFALLKNDYPNYYNFKYLKQVINIGEIQKQIPKKALLLEYFYGDEYIYIIGISKDQVSLNSIDRTADLEKDLEVLISQLRSNEITFDKVLSANIFNILVRPTLKNIPVKVDKLLIVTDGILGYLPFEVFVENEEYILKKYTLSYANSSTLHFNPLKINRSGEIPYVGFAAEFNGQNFPRLKFNEEEIIKANQYFDGEVLKGTEANETTFRKFAEKANILHLSTHATINDANPVYSAFYLSRSSDDTVDDVEWRMGELDATIHLYEIYNLSLNANLTVLSACETGSGKFARGEGIMSLGRAFQYAGCPSVALSLWQINDRSTTLIIGSFFEHLSEGMHKDVALNKAKIKFLNDPQNKYFQHPYYWSGVILTGDTDPLKVSAFNINYLLVLAFVPFIILFIRRKINSSKR